MNNLLLVWEAIGSQVVTLWNVSPYKLSERLDNVLYSHPLVSGGFDIIQHLGLLYHLRDPFLSPFSNPLGHPRRGHDAAPNCDRSVYRFGLDATQRRRAQFNPDDFTTWWAPTLPCLGEMLRLSFFEMDPESPRFCNHKETTCRVALRAKAVSPTDSIEDRYLLDPSYGHGLAEHLSRLQGT
jgi:tRNA (mo5U34)-methyltransferase